MSNRTPIPKAKSGGEALRQWPDRSKQHPPRLVISFNGFLEGIRDRRLCRFNRNRLAGAHQHDDLSVKISTAA